MDKVYDHKSVEDKIYKKWEESGSFKPEINPDGKPFTVILPPPNANAPLHFGHAMYIIEDILIRYHRMIGDSTLWLPGADHAGFETQFVFEKELQKKGKSRFDYDRETLYKMIWDFVQDNRGTMENQLRRLGYSLDWSRNKFTLDTDVIKIVYKTFKKLYEDGLVYRDLKLVNYCTKDGTGFSDLEIVHVEQKDPLYYMKYGPFVLATVRPETKFGDTAIAVHPTDRRYKKYIGQEIEFESLIGKVRLQVIGDIAVDPKFGTGVVKVTPSHDFTDFEIGKSHNLEMKQVIDFDGKLTELAGKYAGLKVKEAREIVAKDLEEAGLLEKVDENYTHNVATCYKCGRVLEPLPLEQWYVKVRPLADEGIKIIKDKKIKFVPKRFEKTAIDWLTNFHDWNISRQLVWGIRIPAWKCEECSEWTVTEGKTPKKCAKCNSKGLTQDTDTFDTWFSSSQWPFATLQTSYGLPKMGFHEEVVPQVLEGKTKTYRLRNHGLKVGDKVLFENTQAQTLFGYGIITEIKETTIDKIDYADKTHFKTYKSIDELMDAFKLRNPDKEVTLKSKAYLYSYELHSSEELGQISSDFEKFYPTSVMETGYDILPWWVARMIMIGLFATGKVPFKKVYLHGLVRDSKGQKMSKSKGNVVNPMDMVEKYSADAVRMALVFGAAAGNDQALAEEKIRGMRNFTNKLWNIARFISMKREALNPNFETRNNLAIEQLNNGAIDEKDKQIIEDVQDLIEQTTKHVEKFELNLAAEELYEFIWHEFADKYIEDVKDRIDEDSFLILNSCFIILLKLLHPFMPFITEEIFGKFTGNMLITEKWPTFAEATAGKPS